MTTGDPGPNEFESPFVDRESSPAPAWGEHEWDASGPFEGEAPSAGEGLEGFEPEGQIEPEAFDPESGDDEDESLLAESEDLGPDDEGEDEWLEEGEVIAGGASAPLQVRILWPALGFPAVIAPRPNISDPPLAASDCTRCITLLLVSNQRTLSKAEVSRHLRFVPWAERGRRFIKPTATGSFPEVELDVRNHAVGPALTMPGPSDDRTTLLWFGGDKEGKGSIVGGVSKRVLEVYRNAGLQYLHEVRVYEHASNRLRDGLYHLFWNNARSVEDAPSDELGLLLQRVARPRREKLGKLWRETPARLMAEYEFEYGALQRPYLDRYRGAKRRAEILHPVFVRRNQGSVLKIGHLTDTHVDVRMDVYEENLARDAGKLDLRGQPLLFNNWNQAFVKGYAGCRDNTDLVLITGDLIDYGRGHWGLGQRERLGDDTLYQSDRNWFLFYYLLAADDSYSQPTYTILGNHDWRLNPYPPFAIAGTPSPATMIHNATSFTDQTRSRILATAHGNGYRRMISYRDGPERRSVRPSWFDSLIDTGKLFVSKPLTAIWTLLATAFGNKQTLDEPGLPTETTVESVEWYLLTINPFLDYRFRHPAGPEFLMLDWAEDENVMFSSIVQGKRFGDHSGDEGPTARNCLSEQQWHLVKQFATDPGTAKVIGIHAPPISPWDDWPDDEIRAGWRAFDLASRGYPHYSAKASNGRTVKGHPMFAIRPAKGVVPDAVHGMDASYNSFERHRADLINLLAKSASVRLVLSGHVHRAGAYLTYPAASIHGPAVAGERLIGSVTQKETLGVRPPAASLRKVRTSAAGSVTPTGPLYVIGTSAGPRGHGIPTRKPDKKVLHGYVDPGFAYLELGRDGTIHQVTFRWVRPGAPATPPAPGRTQPVPAGVGGP